VFIHVYCVALCVCTYCFIYTHTYIRIHTYIHVYIHIYRYIQIFIHMYMYICMYTRIHICIHICIYTYTHTHINECKFMKICPVHLHIYMHIYMCLHIYFEVYMGMRDTRILTPSLVRMEHVNKTMRWLRLVCSLKLQVSFAKEPYERDLYSAKETILCKRDL